MWIIVCVMRVILVKCVNCQHVLEFQQQMMEFVAVMEHVLMKTPVIANQNGMVPFVNTLPASKCHHFPIQSATDMVTVINPTLAHVSHNILALNANFRFVLVSLPIVPKCAITAMALASLQIRVIARESFSAMTAHNFNVLIWSQMIDAFVTMEMVRV